MREKNPRALLRRVPDHPIRENSTQRKMVRRMVRQIHEKPWRAEDLLWNMSQSRLTSLANAKVGDKLKAL